MAVGTVPCCTRPSPWKVLLARKGEPGGQNAACSDGGGREVTVFTLEPPGACSLLGAGGGQGAGDGGVLGGDLGAALTGKPVTSSEAQVSGIRWVP